MKTFRLFNWLQASPKHPLQLGLAAMVLFAAVQANGMFAVLRFGSIALNQIFFLLSFTLPCLALVALFQHPRLWVKALALVMFLPVFAYSLVCAPVTAFITAHTIRVGYDPTFQLLATVPMEPYRVRIFRTDCGATCTYGIALRQERRLVPGLFLVRQLAGFDRLYDAPYRVVGRDSLMVNDRLYVLRPLP